MLRIPVKLHISSSSSLAWPEKLKVIILEQHNIHMEYSRHSICWIWQWYIGLWFIAAWLSLDSQPISMHNGRSDKRKVLDCTSIFMNLCDCGLEFLVYTVKYGFLNVPQTGLEFLLCTVIYGCQHHAQLPYSALAWFYTPLFRFNYYLKQSVRDHVKKAKTYM